MASTALNPEKLFVLPKFLASRNPREYAQAVCSLYGKAYRLTEGGYNLLLQATMNAYESAGVFGNQICLISWEDSVMLSEDMTLEIILDKARELDENSATILSKILSNTQPLTKYLNGIEKIRKEIKDATVKKSSSFAYMTCQECGGNLDLNIESLTFLESGASNGGYLLNFTCPGCGKKSSEVYGLTRAGVIKGHIVIGKEK